MNWYRKAQLTKIAGYSPDDSIDPQLRQLYERVHILVGKVSGADKIEKKINTALGSWNANRQSPDPNKQNFGRATAMKAMREAQEFLARVPGFPKNDPFFAYVQQTRESNWQHFGSNPDTLAQNIKLVPGKRFNRGKPGPSEWIFIDGVQLHPFKSGIKNPHAEMVEQQMGDAMLYMDDYDIYIRGTVEAWNKFLGLSGWIFKNDAALRKYRFPQPLPSEAQFNPTYQAQTAGLKRKDKPFTATAVEGYTDATRLRKPMNGVKLTFDPKDPAYHEDFPTIRDFILQDERTQLNPSKVRIYWDAGEIEIYDIKSNDTNNAERLYRLKKKLQDMGYANTGSLGKILTDLTGISEGKAYENFSNEKRSKVRSVVSTLSALDKNVYANGPRLSSRFAAIKAQLGIMEDGPLSSEDHQKIMQEFYKGNITKVDAENKPIGPFGPENWVGPYGPDISSEQRQAQTEGMGFVSSRVTSILADEPGAGKTAQAIVGADSTREEGKKILIISPNNLVRENWNGPDAKGPMYFCGHDRRQIAIVKNAEEAQRAINDPNIIWVVIRQTDLSRGGKFKGISEGLAQTIGAAAKADVFSSLIIDEIQELKSQKANLFDNLQTAIPMYAIPHRIGLTGTPADNKPTDMWMQLMILRHRVLFEDKGISNLVTTQNADGFAEQYLGGKALSEGLELTSDERSMDNETTAKIMQQKWTQKALGVFSWLHGLNNNRKQSILDLFSNTFLRREKEDINPNLRNVAPVNGGIDPKTNQPIEPSVIQAPTDSQVANMKQTGHGWHTEAMMQAAMAKAATTAKQAIEILSSDPTQKIFIGSNYIEPTRLIAKQINAALGPGTAMAINGVDTDEAGRAAAAAAFRSGKDETGNPLPLRAVIYTSGIGAVGLNFNNAQWCLMNDINWNPSINEQMTMRVDRIDTKHPIHIRYTMMPGSYDAEMFARITQKREINKAMTNMMREARRIIDPAKKVEIANTFVKTVINNMVIGAGLDPEHLKWFQDNLDRAFKGEPTETWEQLQQREEYKKHIHEMGRENHRLDPFMPDWLRKSPATLEEAKMLRTDRKEWRQQEEEKLAKHFGPNWTDLPHNVLADYFARQEAAHRAKLEEYRQRERELAAQLVNSVLRKISDSPANDVNGYNWYKRNI